jgi:hypothetical protein
MPDDYRNRETHAVTLASGRPLAPGDAAPLTTDEPGDVDPHDQGLLDEGSLVLVDETTDYDALSVEALTNLAISRDVTVKGTGKDGTVLKADLVKALQSDDKKRS